MEGIVSYYEQDRLCVINLTGELSHATVKSINEYLREIVPIVQESAWLLGMVFDCEHLEFIDSAGVGLILGKSVAMKKSNKKFALCDVSERLYQFLSTAKIDRLLTVYPNSMQALISLGVNGVSVSNEIERVLKKKNMTETREASSVPAPEKAFTESPKASLVGHERPSAAQAVQEMLARKRKEQEETARLPGGSLQSWMEQDRRS